MKRLASLLNRRAPEWADWLALAGLLAACVWIFALRVFG